MAARLHAIHRMKRSLRFALGIPLAAIMFAQSEPHLYRGNLVNANCLQASEIVSRNSRGYTPPSGVNAFTGSSYKAVPLQEKRKEILRHCRLHAGVTQFGFLNDEGNFFKLDESGNLEVLSRALVSGKKARVTIKGFIDREKLIVNSVSRF